MASQMQTITKMRSGQGLLDWPNGDFRLALSSSATVPSPDGTVYLSSMTNELSGTGYSRKTLTGKSMVEDTTAKCAKFMADNVTWTGIDAGTVATIWLYLYNAGGDGSSIVHAVFDPADLTTNGSDVVLKWDGQASNGKAMTF